MWTVKHTYLIKYRINLAGFLNIGRWPKGKPRLANFGLMDQVAGKLIIPSISSNLTHTQAENPTPFAGYLIQPLSII